MLSYDIRCQYFFILEIDFNIALTKTNNVDNQQTPGSAKQREITLITEKWRSIYNVDPLFDCFQQYCLFDRFKLLNNC